MGAPSFAPVVVAIATPLAVTNAALVHFPIPERFNEVELLSAALMVRALTSGTLTVEIRRLVSGALLDTISVTAAGPGGIVVHDNLQAVFDLLNAGVRIDVTSIGVGALDLTLTLWLAIDPQGS